MDALEQIALCVNGSTWRLRDVLKLAYLESGFTAIDDGIRNMITLTFAAQQGLSVSEQECKAKVNEMRRQFGLYGVAETETWLRQRGLATVDLFEAAKTHLLADKVKRLVTEDHIDAYFLGNRLNFDRANVSQLVVSSREQAQELLFQLEEDEPFFRLAQSYCIRSSSKYDGGYLGWISRGDLNGEEESLVFGAESGQTVGPFKSGSCYRLLHVWDVAQASLTEEIRKIIAASLFEEWLQNAVIAAEVDIPLQRMLLGGR